MTNCSSRDRKPLVLIADDEPGQRLLLKEALEQSDFMVIEAEDGAQALSAFENLQPDIALLDVMMPELNGFEVCKELRRRPETKHLPIIMITGLDDAEAVQTAYKVGATNFLTKPLNWMVLQQNVRFALRAHHTENSLREAMFRAEESNNAKSQFLATMSHELRTPLNAIIGFSQIMCVADDLAEIHKEYSGDIRDAGNHLLEIINDILDFAKLDSGNLEIRAEEVDPGHALESCVKLVKHQAAEHGLDLVSEIQNELPAVTLDAQRFKQVVINLLTNAVKFTPPGGRVALQADIRHDELQVSVSDSGIGIPPDQLEQIRQPFYQVDGSLQRRYEGVGLGLTISDAFVRACGGRMTIESELGSGTTVTLYFETSASTESNFRAA